MKITSSNLTVNSCIRFVLLLIFGICAFGINTYLIGANVFPLPPLIYTILIIGLLAIFIFLNPKKPVPYFNPATILYLAYISFFIVHFFLIQGSSLSFEVVKSHINALSYFPIWYLLFQMDETLQHRAQKIMVWVVLLTVPMLIFHVFAPFSFTPLEISNPGRASGFYLNPNIAGIAVVMCMLSAISIIPSKWKSLFLVWAGIGIFITFSRSAILIFSIVTAGLFITRQIERRQALLTFIGATAILFFLAIIAYQYLQTIKSINLDNIVDRILWFQNLGEGSDYSAVKRKQLFWEGLRLATENPLLGHGAGIMAHRTANLHNMYLLLFVEYGILGLLLFPIFIIILFIKGLQSSHVPLVLFALTLLINGFFSHNIIDDYTTLICAALLFSIANKKSSGGKNKK